MLPTYIRYICVLMRPPYLRYICVLIPRPYYEVYMCPNATALLSGIYVSSCYHLISGIYVSSYHGLIMRYIIYVSSCYHLISGSAWASAQRCPYRRRLLALRETWCMVLCRACVMCGRLLRSQHTARYICVLIA